MLRRIVVTAQVATVGLLACVASQVDAADRETVCAASRLKESAKYMSCLLKAQSVSVQGVSVPEFGKCDTKFADGWAKAEAKGAGACPKTGESSEAQEILFAGAQAVATAPSIATAENACEAAKLKVAGKYATCRLKRESSSAKSGRAADFSKCDVAFAAGWQSVETKSAGQCPSTGDETEVQGIVAASSVAVRVALSLNPTVQCGDNTVTDPNTGLTWQLIDDDGGLTDKDKRYSWCVDENHDQVCDNFLAFDGTAATVFLAGLNTPPCFGGRCDWRLPTASEFASILDPACASDAECCIDESVSGPSGGCSWWSPHTTPATCYYDGACYMTYMDLDECPPLGDLLWRTDSWTGSDAVILTGYNQTFRGLHCVPPPEEGYNCFGEDPADSSGSCGGLYANKPNPFPVRAVSSGECS